MKILLNSLLGFLFVFSALVFNSCKPEKCKNVVCAYSGACEEGLCKCQIGYEGDHCETIVRDKFKGVYSVTEDGTISGFAQYAMSIEIGDKINEVRIKNFYNRYKTEDVIGVCLKDSLFIYPQTMSDGYKIEGSGKIVDTNPLSEHYFQSAILDVTYKITDAANLTDEFGTGGSQPSIWSK